MKNEKLEAFFRYFSGLEIAKGDFRYTPVNTDVGSFLPSSLIHLSRLFPILISEGIVDTSKPFLDAGSGDGRVAALASVFGFRSFGIEYDPKLVEDSQRNISGLVEQGIIDEGSTRIIRGNFMDRSCYDRFGRRFDDFGTVYNFFNNQWDIDLKINGESPKGTRFLFYDYRDKPLVFFKLRCVRSFDLKEISGWDGFCLEDAPNPNPDPLGDYRFDRVHVYEK